LSGRRSALSIVGVLLIAFAFIIILSLYSSSEKESDFSVKQAGKNVPVSNSNRIDYDDIMSEN